MLAGDQSRIGYSCICMPGNCDSMLSRDGVCEAESFTDISAMGLLC